MINFANALYSYAEAYDKANGKSTTKTILEITSQFKNFLNQYSFVDPTVFPNEQIAYAVTAFSEGKVIMLMKGAASGEDDIDTNTVRMIDAAIKYLCPEFTYEDAGNYETECGYVAGNIKVPFFKVTLCYSIDDNGDLLVSVPANLIEYPRDFCSLETITPLRYFSAGDMDKDGYVFFPDGSGAIVEFKDFYYGSSGDKANLAITLGDGIPMYGSDYCYAKITGQHREQLVMPVYGLVNEMNSSNEGYSEGLSTVTNGFFAVIEEGSALASLTYLSGGGIDKFISVYSSFAPFPTDTYNLSQSISVSGLGSYTTATEAKFTGTMTTRYTMLVDHEIYSKAIADDAKFSGYVSDYVGMATYYRNYLEKNGTIELIKEEDTLSDLPLYIEALGSIDVTKKILSFPVTVSEPLTTFEDVKKMYKEFSEAIDTLNDKAQEYEDEAAELQKEEHPELHENEINRCIKLAQKYRDLAKKIVNIKNINFKLVGFANGGMHGTYPAKLKWEKSVGGSKGFRDLLDTAADTSSKKEMHFGVYPDFDFMYISNTAAFDGVGRRGTAACMVDNRYASKQEYNSVNQEFESLFALVISSDSLDKLFGKFDKYYSKYNAKTLSVSTLTSDLNSNFDKKNSVVREDSLNAVTALLDKMSEKYSLMGGVGNIYTVKYLDHIIKAPIDSSHYNVISYTVPFYGMVLHGYINYTGTPLNYSGSPEYEMLRSIENGAALYYILCMNNTNYLKEDPILSKYYGVDYDNWFEKIVAQYKTVNDAIGNLQNYRIVDHTKVLAERIINDEEMDANYVRLINEFAAAVGNNISDNIDAAIKEMREEGKIGEGVKFSVSDSDFAAILEVFADRVNLSSKLLSEKYGLDKAVRTVVESYAEDYSEGNVAVTVTAEDVKDYKTKYAYITDSGMFDENYVYTDFTCDNGNVVMVTYEKETNGKTEQVMFILNYNIFSVKIKLDDSIREQFAEYCDEDGYVVLDKYGYLKG